MTCVKMGIRYQAIPVEFEVRFLAYLNNANYVFCAMCPAYMRYFNAKWEAKLSSKPAILVTLTEKFAIPSLAYALKPVFEEIKKLDKTLQKYTLFPEEACVLDKFKATLEKKARKSMSTSQRNFYADNELEWVIPPGKVNKQYSICGIKLKNYTSGHAAARSACVKVKKVLFKALLERFPVEKQKVWRSLGLLFNSKN